MHLKMRWDLITNPFWAIIAIIIQKNITKVEIVYLCICTHGWGLRPDYPTHTWRHILMRGENRYVLNYPLWLVRMNFNAICKTGPSMELYFCYIVGFVLSVLRLYSALLCCVNTWKQHNITFHSTSVSAWAILTGVKQMGDSLWKDKPASQHMPLLSVVLRWFQWCRNAV